MVAMHWNLFIGDFVKYITAMQTMKIQSYPYI